MNRMFLFAMTLSALATAVTLSAAGPASFYDLKTQTLLGKPADLGDFRGKVTLVVNVASYCGYTPQYKGLQSLNEKYGGRGLVILGFPSNDFGQQEPGSNKEIADFCDRTYAVKFPMFAKTAVKDAGKTPLYDDLAKVTGERPKWNFHKYLIARDGKSAVSVPTKVDPESKEFVAKLEELLR